MSADSTGRLLGGAGLALGLVGLYQADQADTRVRGLVADVTSARAAIPPPVVIPEIPPDRLRFRRVWLGQTGTETCADSGEACVGMRPLRTSLAGTGQFWGYTVPACNSRLKRRDACSPGRNYELDNTAFRKSPRSTINGEPEGVSCLDVNYYDFAVCLVLPDPSEIKPL